MDLLELSTFLPRVQVLDAPVYDSLAHKKLLEEKEWKAHAYHFSEVMISGLAAMKMALHAIDGGDIEVMGLMVGTIIKGAFVVQDATRLPVQGTETRVNAGDQANAHIVKYVEASQALGRDAPYVGWYHSHPGYGCWLSGIDIHTQTSYQAAQDPFVAVVVDPKATIANKALEIGAFRTKGTLENQSRSSRFHGVSQMITKDKIKEYGSYADRYYSLDVKYYCNVQELPLLYSLFDRIWKPRPLLQVMRDAVALQTSLLTLLRNKEPQDAETSRNRARTVPFPLRKLCVGQW
ncbi:MAG: uncharacterized protein KVP18_002890 [Porospora cf. gigantea A]|uniref:uncharacterized protein n=3 Tax=Porospora TaxID=947096 RepID=UPI00355954C7|nr:MAG: hypothetical protein KVP18_002890 [Porospora cf. gigantea A]